MKRRTVPTSTPPRSKAIYWLSAIFGIGLIFIVGSYLWLINIDNWGTFVNTASIADIDADGDLDVIMHGLRKEGDFTAFGGPTVWINLGDRKFLHRDYGEEGSWASKIGDMDRDGDPDLVGFPGLNLRIDFNQGGAQAGVMGEFRRGQWVNSPNKTYQFGSVVLGDLNADGQLDGIVTGCCGSGFPDPSGKPRSNTSWAWIIDYDPRGWMLPRTASLAGIDGLPIGGAALEDVDQDGDLDIFAAVLGTKNDQGASPGNRVLFNDGEGNFSDSGQRLGDQSSASVAMADLEGDGDLDALVGLESGGAQVWINEGGLQALQVGTFARAEAVLTGEPARAVFLADLDNDQDADALVAGNSKALIWWNDGHGKFTLASQRLRVTERLGLGIADFDNDGWLDIFGGIYDHDYKAWFNRGDGTFR